MYYLIKPLKKTYATVTVISIKLQMRKLRAKEVMQLASSVTARVLAESVNPRVCALPARWHTGPSFCGVMACLHQAQF